MFESVGLLFEGATTNHFLSVVCAENTVDMRKIGFEFRYRVTSKFSTNNTMQMKAFPQANKRWSFCLKVQRAFICRVQRNNADYYTFSGDRLR